MANMSWRTCVFVKRNAIQMACPCSSLKNWGHLWPRWTCHLQLVQTSPPIFWNLLTDGGILSRGVLRSGSLSAGCGHRPHERPRPVGLGPSKGWSHLRWWLLRSFCPWCQEFWCRNFWGSVHWTTRKRGKRGCLVRASGSASLVSVVVGV